MRWWFVAALAAGCAKGGAIGGGTTIAPSGSVYLRSSFDADASPYIGRFVPQGARDLDESAAMSLACSEHVGWRFVEGGSVTYTELFRMSREVAARFGVPAVLDARADASSEQVARVEYTLTGKLIGEVTDPAAFQACCESNPTGCSDRYIGEFLQGTGRVYRMRDVQAGGEASGATQGGAGSIVASHGATWEQAIEFPQPVYFAFKISETPFKRVGSTCGSWVDHPPVATHGSFFVGVEGKPQKTEERARNKALRDAWQKAWAAAGGPDMAWSDADASADAPVTDPAMTWAMGMEPREWCVETVTDGGDTRYTARVLGWLPPFER